MKLYLVSRSDLPAGLRAAQLCHALREFVAHHPEHDLNWYLSSNTLVLLEARDELELKELLERLQQHPTAAFHEPDLGGSLTAFAVGGSAKRQVRGLPLAFTVP